MYGLRGAPNRIIAAVLMLLLGALGLRAAVVYHVRGQVIEADTGEPVPYAHIAPVGTYTTHLSDENGRFNINTPRSFSVIIVSAMGYTPDTLRIGNQDPDKLIVRLQATGVELGEVIAKPKKVRYSKKNNPAVDFMQRIRAMQDSIDPRRNQFYNYDFYDRITIAFNDINSDDAILRNLPVLREYVDTSEVSGQPIINVSVKEKAGEVHHRASPRAEKIYISGTSRQGIDEVFNQDAVQTFLDDVLREVDIYGRDVNILQNRFVSPLSPIAADFYKFYLTDTVTAPETGERQIVLSFVPRTSESFGFTGRLYVPEGDSTMFIRRIEMNVPHDINLNWISHLYINQEYERAPDGSRLKMHDDIVAEISILGKGLYVRRNSAYANHDFKNPGDSAFSGPASETMYGAWAQTPEYWAQHRLIPASQKELIVQDMVADLRKNKWYYWGEKIVQVLSTGYVPTGNPSKVDLGPVNTLISFNDLEGVRLRAGALTTAELSPHWFGRGYGAYGIKDHRWKYLGEVEYSFRRKLRHAREFPVHSIALTSMYDVDMLGQHYMFTNPDNVVLSLKRTSDKQMTYHYVNKLVYTLEMHNNFSVTATAQWERQQCSRYITFTNGYGDVLPHYDESSLTLQLRYAPGEKFFQTRTQRIPVNLDAPIIMLTHTIAPKSFLGNTFAVNRTELSMQKRVWFSAFGFADIILKGGHVWSRSPFPLLLIPNANLSYTIQPESYALMNAMEFINDSYASWDLTYWANGAIFNYVPLLKKLRLREVFAFRGLWGHLSHRNRPELNPDLLQFPEDAHTQMMTDTPYMEVSVGLDNLLRIFRLDYVWRLTYRDNPGIDRSGLRIALHITF